MSDPNPSPSPSPDSATHALAAVGRGLGGTTRFMVVAAAAVVLVAGMRAAQAIVVPALLAIFITILAAGPMDSLRRRGVPMIPALLIVMVMIVGVTALFAALIGGSVRELTSALPDYQARLWSQLDQQVRWLQEHGIDVTAEAIRTYANPGAVTQVLSNFLTSLAGLLSYAFLIILGVVFMLLEIATFPEKLRCALRDPDRSLRGLTDIVHRIRHYTVIKTRISIATGLFVAWMLILMDVPYPYLWGLLAFILNYIPTIGSAIAAVPAVMIGWADQGVVVGLGIALLYWIINTVIGGIIEPRVLGRRLGLSTVVVFASLIFWGWVLGPIGMLLSVPLTMVFQIAMDSNDDTRWIARLLAERPIQESTTEETKSDATEEEKT